MGDDSTHSMLNSILNLWFNWNINTFFACFKYWGIFQIFLLLFLLLYLASFGILRKFKRQGREDYYSSDEDEVTVYRISTWLCTFSLAVSIGAVLLLPISIVSNEVLIIYPNSYYIKWLNSSLIHGKLFIVQPRIVLIIY